MEKKIRIQLFTEEGSLVEDRLVSQDIELRNGPKVQHKGPIRIEFSLFDKDDTESAIQYIQKLTGLMPLEAKVKKIKNLKVLDTVDTEQQLLNLIEFVRESKDQDALIKYLREDQGFKFLTTEYLLSYGYPINIKDIHKDKYQWMIRCIKYAKNPVNDKYDPMLIFGINMIERNEKIAVYLNGELKERINIPLPAKPKWGIEKTSILVFPPYMQQDEKDRFRYEYRLHEQDENKEPSKFFKRWYPFVTKPKEVISMVKSDN